MIIDILNEFIWLDYLIIAFLVIFVLISVKRGLINGLFALLSVFCSSIFAIHYYPLISNFLAGRLNFESTIFDLIGYIAVMVFVMLLFWLIRIAFNILIKVEARSIVDKIFGFLSSFIYSLLITSLILVGLYLSTVSYLELAIADSKLAKTFIKPAPKVYEVTWGKVLSKFLPEDEFNNEVYDLLNEESE